MTLEEEYELSFYKDLTKICDGKETYLVKNISDGKIYVRKKLHKFNKDILLRLKDSPVNNIPKIFLCIEDEEDIIVIEEYIHGETLYERQKREGIIEEKEAVEIICDICDILYELHSLNPPVIHRDIKPMNIMISNDGVVKLIDFDAARENVEGEVEDTYLMGTKYFAAPEQYGFGQSDARTDIYALGIMLNVMLSGQLPKDKIYGDDYNMLTGIIKKCIMLEPDKRYSNVSELETELKKYIKNEYLVTDNQLSDSKITNIIKDKNNALRKYFPVGFRTGKLWKMIIAAVSYIIIVCVCYGMELENDDGTAYKVRNVWGMRIFLLMICIGSIEYLGNYMGIRYKLPGTEKKGLLHYVMSIIYCCAYIFILFVVMVILMI